MSYGWNLEVVRKIDGCQFMHILSTWVSKGVWYYSSGMFLQDVTLFPVSMVAGKKCVEYVENNACEITDVLARFLLGSADIAGLILIERFIVLFYNRTGSTDSVNDTRSWLFTKIGLSKTALQPWMRYYKTISFYFTKQYLAPSSECTPTPSRSKPVWVEWPYEWPLQ